MAFGGGPFINCYLSQLSQASSTNYCRLQSAYCTDRSTETALVKIVDDILGHIDGGSVIALVSLDISAAFDMVDHNLLLERFSVEFGVTAAARDWIASYLRSQSFSSTSDNRHLTFVHRMLTSLRDPCSVRNFYSVCLPPSVVSLKVLASSTMATLTILNYTQNSKVTWDRVSINCRSAPLHCSTGSGSTLYSSIQTSQTSPFMERGRV